MCARRVLAEPIVVRTRRVLIVCYDYAALGLCLSLIDFPPGIRLSNLGVYTRHIWFEHLEPIARKKLEN